MDNQKIKNTFLQILSLPAYLLLTSVLYFLFRMMGLVFVSQSINFVTIFIVISLTVKSWIAYKTGGKDILYFFYPYVPLIAFGFIIIRLIATTTHTVTFNIMVITTLVCSLVLFFRFVQKSKLKAILGVIYILLAALVSLIVLVGIFFYFVWMPPGGVEANRISELSPNGAYIVEVIQRSEGALGGSTIVTVQRTARFNLLLGELQYRSVDVHQGRWIEFFNIENIRWDGNERFYIYRSVYLGGETFVFELTKSNWLRVN